MAVSKLTLIITVEHPEGFEPSDHFVYYLADDHEFGIEDGDISELLHEWERMLD